MRRMEAMLQSSSVDWTVMRPASLFTTSAPIKWIIGKDHVPGPLTARSDLAAAMSTTVEDQSYSRSVAAVITTAPRLRLASVLWNETVGKRKLSDRV